MVKQKLCCSWPKKGWYLKTSPMVPAADRLPHGSALHIPWDMPTMPEVVIWSHLPFFLVKFPFVLWFPFLFISIPHWTWVNTQHFATEIPSFCCLAPAEFKHHRDPGHVASRSRKQSCWQWGNPGAEKTHVSWEHIRTYSANHLQIIYTWGIFQCHVCAMEPWPQQIAPGYCWSLLHHEKPALYILPCLVSKWILHSNFP